MSTDFRIHITSNDINVTSVPIVTRTHRGGLSLLSSTLTLTLLCEHDSI